MIFPEKKRVWIPLLLFAFFCLMAAYPYLNDDSVISYRYAWNLVRGYGLVSYVDGPRVEGFSNPLLVFGVAGISFFMHNQQLPVIFRIGTALNYCAALGIILFLIYWGYKRHGNRWVAYAPAILTAVFYPFARSPGTGLETVLYIFFLLIMARGFSENKIRSASLAGTAMALTRAEGAILVAFCLILFIFKTPGDIRKRIKTLRPVLWGFILPMILFIIFRYLYFHSWVPNTVIVKTHLSERGAFSGKGVAYLVTGFSSAPVLILAVALMVFVLIQRKRFHFLQYPALLVATQILFIIAVGGDEYHFGHYRFILPIIPLLFLFAGECFSFVQPRTAVLLFILCMLSAQFEFNTTRRSLQLFWRQAACDFIASPKKTLQKHLHDLVNPEPWIDAGAGAFVASLVPENGKHLSLASCQAGSLPISWAGRFDDLVGLLSPEYARVSMLEKNNVFLENPPDILLAFRWRTGWFAVPQARVLKKLGFKPFILIQLKEKIRDCRTDYDFVVNFLVLARDISIFPNLAKVPWNARAEVAYDDDTGVLKNKVLVKIISFDHGI